MLLLPLALSLITWKGSRHGHDTVVDAILKDGLLDVYNQIDMGDCAEIIAEKYSIAREEQDNSAILSYERGIAAHESGAFKWEMVPVEVPGGKGKPSIVVDKDESLDKFDADKMRKLPTVFKENGGTVIAGNASSMSCHKEDFHFHGYPSIHYKAFHLGFLLLITAREKTNPQIPMFNRVCLCF